MISNGWCYIHAVPFLVAILVKRDAPITNIVLHCDYVPCIELKTFPKTVKCLVFAINDLATRPYHVVAMTDDFFLRRQEISIFFNLAFKTDSNIDESTQLYDFNDPLMRGRRHNIHSFVHHSASWSIFPYLHSFGNFTSNIDITMTVVRTPVENLSLLVAHSNCTCYFFKQTLVLADEFAEELFHIDSDVIKANLDMLLELIKWSLILAESLENTPEIRYEVFSFPFVIVLKFFGGAQADPHINLMFYLNSLSELIEVKSYFNFKIFEHSVDMLLRTSNLLYWILLLLCDLLLELLEWSLGVYECTLLPESPHDSFDWFCPVAWMILLNAERTHKSALIAIIINADAIHGLVWVLLAVIELEHFLVFTFDIHRQTQLYL